MTQKIARPLTRSHMPNHYAISLDQYIGRQGIGGGYQDGEPRIPQDFGLKQSMKGFEETYQNIIDYIVRITYTIWEDRHVEYIGQTYSHDSQVFDDYGLQIGSQKIISDTYHTTKAFTNIQLLADEVIWAGDDEIGYRSSHRTLIRGKNDGHSKYGKATYNNIDVLVIANCVSLGNEIFLEHVLYNNSAMLRQLGFDLNEKVQDLVNHAPAGFPRSDQTWQLLKTSNQQNPPLYISEPIEGFDIDRFCRETIQSLWNDRTYDVLEANYSKQFIFQGATDRTGHGTKNYQKMLDELLSPFADLSLQVDEVYWMGNSQEGYLVSIRWSVECSHHQNGIYGSPTHVPLQMWGITQQKIVHQKIVQEWMLWNELDVMMQIQHARNFKT